MSRVKERRVLSINDSLTGRNILGRASNLLITLSGLLGFKNPHKTHSQWTTWLKKSSREDTQAQIDR